MLFLSEFCFLYGCIKYYFYVLNIYIFFFFWFAQAFSISQKNCNLWFRSFPHSLVNQDVSDSSHYNKLKHWTCTEDMLLPACKAIFSHPGECHNKKQSLKPLFNFLTNCFQLWICESKLNFKYLLCNTISSRFNLR